MNEKKPPVAQYVVLGLLFFVACAYQVRATIASFPGFLDRRAAAWPFIPGYVHGEPKAAFVGREGRQAGIHEGDILMAVKGRTFTGLAVLVKPWPRRGPEIPCESCTRDRVHR